METVPVGAYTPDTTTVIRRARPGEASAFLAEQMSRPPESFDPTTCLLWPFAISSGGYGNIGTPDGNVAPHRVMCAEHHGPPASPDLYAAHSCGVRRCMNPCHLRWATPLENRHDTEAHGTSMLAGAYLRDRTHCPQGHPYDEANTRVYAGHRNCRACDRQRPPRQRAA